jgi:hypothetical protein
MPMLLSIGQRNEAWKLPRLYDIQSQCDWIILYKMCVHSYPRLQDSFNQARKSTRCIVELSFHISKIGFYIAYTKNYHYLHNITITLQYQTGIWVTR